MLKKITLVILILVSLKSFSQKKEFGAAIYGGFTATQIDGDGYYGYHKAGPVLGSWVNRKFNKKLAWQLGLQYIQKGSKEVKKNNYTARLNYVDFPITLRYFHYKKLDFEGGLALGYLIKATEEFEKTGFINTTSEFSKLDFCSIIGLNYKINEKIFLTGALEYSILNTRKRNPNIKNSLIRGQRNHLIYFTLNYKLR